MILQALKCKYYQSYNIEMFSPQAANKAALIF